MKENKVTSKEICSKEDLLTNNSEMLQDKRNNMFYLPTPLSFKDILFKIIFTILDDISPFCGTTDTLVLDFWWSLSWVSKPGSIPSLVCFVAYVQQNPQVYLWCDTCWPLCSKHGSQAILINIVESRIYCAIALQHETRQMLYWLSYAGLAHLNILEFNFRI